MRLFLLLLSACFIACGSAVVTPTEQGKQVNGTVQIHKRYCGGAAPSPEQQRGYFKAMPAAEFFIQKGEANAPGQPTVGQFTTDEEGHFEVQLAPGTYSVLQADKALSLEKFKAKKAAQGANYENASDQCFQDWYNKADFVLVVNRDTTVELNYRSRCFTGTNPCLMYTGPMPP